MVRASTEELVRRTIAGDRAAFGSLYDRHAPAVQRFLVAQRLELDHQEVEDAVQETFMRLHGLLPRFEPRRPFEPYLLGIARLVALETERKGRPPLQLRERPRSEVEALTVEAEAARTVLRAEESSLVAQALAAIPAEARAVISLRFVSGLTMKGLADSLSVSVPTARSRLRAAARGFAAELSRLGVAPEEARA